jgi:CubicO group peptidase (beta-lactamase class C family)
LIGTVAAALAVAAVLAGCTGAAPRPATTPAATGSAAADCAGQIRVTQNLCRADSALASTLAAATTGAFRDDRLGALIVGVWKDGKPLLQGALGESLPGVPATVDMHHRAGNISAGVLTTVFLKLVDEKKLTLDAKLSTWYPQVPGAQQVTLEMLARSTSGYDHYPQTDAFQKAFYADPFRTWTIDQLLPFGAAQQPAFAPGTSWKFADINFILLQGAIEKATGESLNSLAQRYVYGPLRLTGTTPPDNAELPSPVLHAFTNERGVWEESTYWNPQWTKYAGGLGSTQSDLRTIVEAIGTGRLLSPSSHALQTATENVGLGPNTASRHYAMGVAVVNGWVIANPSLQGYRAVVAYLPKAKITVVLYVTLRQDADQDGRQATALFRTLGGVLAPGNAPVDLR